MVNKEQIFNGLIKYIDNEVIPHLPTHGKWMIGTFAFLLSSKYEQAFQMIMQTDMAEMLGIINPEGMVDIDKLADALMNSADKYGKLQLTVPGLNPMAFSREDVEMLKQYITGAR